MTRHEQVYLATNSSISIKNCLFNYQLQLVIILDKAFYLYVQGTMTTHVQHSAKQNYGGKLSKIRNDHLLGGHL